MPNGTDCANILQTEALCVPTQWFVLDCTADGRVCGLLHADLPGEIDYFHLGRAAGATADLKASVVALRPKALHALLDTYELRRSAGSAGRLVVWLVADLAEPLGRQLLAELPLDIANLMFWKTGFVPAVVRVGVGGGDEDTRRYLSQVRDQYFALPDFTGPYYGRHTPGQLYGNEFDSTLLCAGDDELRVILDHLVPLHLEESRYARSHLQRHRSGGIFVIEDVMKNSLKWRKIDWLAVTCYPYFPRLWDARRHDILDLLDYRRCPARQKDPWAALSQRSREKNWDDLGLDPAPFDPLSGEEPYRITPGDHRSRLQLADFLVSHQHGNDAFRHCALGRGEGGYDADDRWIRTEALAHHASGDEQRARELFSLFRQRLQEDPDPSARTLDEIATAALMEGDFTLAYESARKAVEKDRFYGHAYDTMVIAGRESGNPAYETAAAELAAANGVSVPLHVREKASEVLKTAEVVKVEPEKAERKRWWQFWK